MNFVAIRSNGIMAVENATMKMDVSPWLSDNVEILTWNGDEGLGKIEYNDRTRLFEKIGFGSYFNEPVLASYVPMIERWMTVAASELTLAQAKQLKLEVVDALYKNKRIQPLQYGAYWYEATDKAVLYMTAFMIGGSSSQLNGLLGQVNTALSNMTWYVNDRIVNHYNAFGSAANRGMQTFSQASFPTFMSGTQSVSFGSMSHGTLRFARPGGTRYILEYGFSHMNQIPTESVGGGSASPILWLPLNTTAPVNIPYADFSAALTSILNRRRNLDVAKIARKNTINAQTTVAGVIAADITTGW